MGSDGVGPCRLVPFKGGSEGKQVGPMPSVCTEAAWSPDGQWMYFAANAGGGSHLWRQRFPDGVAEGEIPLPRWPRSTSTDHPVTTPLRCKPRPWRRLASPPIRL